MKIYLWGEWLGMEWTSSFIIYRVLPDAKVEEVYHANDLKTAKYWLTYIAQPGDVLCKTPIHPKHSKGSKRPEYWCHKETSGTASSEETRWRKYIEGITTNVAFPEEQLSKGEQ